MGNKKMHFTYFRILPDVRLFNNKIEKVNSKYLPGEPFLVLIQVIFYVQTLSCRQTLELLLEKGFRVPTNQTPKHCKTIGSHHSV
jgi:hypothetical protein